MGDEIGITGKSRVCVKNLPKYITLNRFKDHFSQIGELTDAILLRTKVGTSRRMGFVGYKTEQKAQEAIKYFNKSYVDCCRIVCEVALKSADPNIPPPWSRYSKQKEKSAEKKILFSEIDTKIERNGNNNINEIADPKLQEFLQVMRPCSKRKFWGNDLEAPMHKQACTLREKPAQLNQPVWKKSTEIPGIDTSSQKEGRMHHENPTKSHKSASDFALTDMDYFKSRIRKDWTDSESDADENGFNYSQGDDCPAQGNQINFGNQSCHPGSADRMLQTCRIYVWNLPYVAMEDEVAEFFNAFGKVKDVHLVIDKETKQSRGVWCSNYHSLQVIGSLLALGDQIFQGRVVHVVPAENARGLHDLEIHVPEGKGKTYKQQREEKRKALETNGDTRAWNSLFMRTDTIVENMTRKYGVSKRVLLDREVNDVAVRIALGETNIIAETKEALTKAGVNVVSLEEFIARKSEGAKRSNHILLVKNLPFSSSKGELSEMFGRFGSLDNVIFPSTRTLALVIFVEPSEARAAFNCLRYKRYRDSILYLEWAPSNILCQDLVPSGESKNDVDVTVGEAKEVLLHQQHEEMDQIESDSDRAEMRTLYVKNLNFGTTDEKLGKHFRERVNEGKILRARVVKHLEDGKYISRGYGFVEFDSSKTANNLLGALQETILDGHMLKLQLSQPKKDARALKKAQKGQISTKLIVRNLPFEATKKELRQLFSPFGQVKSLRLPKRIGGRTHRGFAFVEYSTKQETNDALKALSRIHLYGRPMIIERANEGETLRELRARIAAQNTNDQGMI